MQKFFEKVAERSVLVFVTIFVVSLLLGALLFFVLSNGVGPNWAELTKTSVNEVFGTNTAGDAGGFLQGVWGTAGSLAASFVAIVLAQQALKLTRQQNHDQDAQTRREQEQMRFNATHDISAQLSQIFASVAAFDVALDLAFRRSGELANQMMVSMGTAAHDYLRLTTDSIVNSGSEQYKLHDHALLMAQYVKREEFDMRLDQVKSAIGMMADALEGILTNGVAATAYCNFSYSGPSPDAQGGPVAPSDLVRVVSLMRNKAESRISDDQLVRMWFLAIAPDRLQAEEKSLFNDKYILPLAFLKNVIATDHNTAVRSWALLGSLIGTVQRKEKSKEFEFSNFGLALLRDVCAILPNKPAIREVIVRQHSASRDLLDLYVGSIDSWPNMRQDRVDISKSLAEHPEVLSGSGQGPSWDRFSQAAWQLAAARIGTDAVLSLNLSRKLQFECKKLGRRDDLCEATAHFFCTAHLFYRVPVGEIEGPEVKSHLYRDLPFEASEVLSNLIHSPWFRGGLEARKNALNAAEKFFSWLILYRGDDPNVAMQLMKIDSCRLSLKDDSRALEINRLARVVLVDQACVSHAAEQRRIANNESIESVLRSFVSLIGHIEELAMLDGDLILHEDVVKLCNELNGLTQYQGFDERSLCAEVVPRLRTWKGNSQLLNKETEEFVSALDNGCISALF